MKRSIRNGLAVVGMAGGMWLLGHAVANAATDAQPADTGTAVTQTATPPGGDSSSTDSTTVSNGTNDNSTGTSTGDTTGGSGGGNGASANTGATSGDQASTPPTQPDTQTASDQTPTTNYEGDPSKPVTSVTIVTGDVNATQQANGGDVADSGNVAADSTTNQSATAGNNGSSSTGTGGDKSSSSSNSSSASQNTGSSDGSNGSSTDQNSSASNTGDNGGKNIAESGNDNSTSVSTGDISGGNGGSNSVDINTGLIGNTFNCPEHSTCIYNITTGNVTVYQYANGGNVTNSGNVSIGAKQPKPPAEATPPPAPPAPPVGVKTVAKKTAVLSGAQPTHTLATTGAETSTPLTAGLLALGAGTALTLAGRRRRQVETA